MLDGFVVGVVLMAENGGVLLKSGGERVVLSVVHDVRFVAVLAREVGVKYITM
jgi:hypothetical protein